MKQYAQWLIESSKEGLEDVSNYHSERGTQWGSNPGGLMTHPVTGEKHYVKFYSNPEQARVEHATGQIYKHMGINTLDTRLVHSNGKIGIASQYNPHIKPVGYHNHHDFNDADHHQIVKGYVGASLMKNWDHIGLDVDNIVKDHHTGSVISVDHGGAMNFRAMGGHKPFDHNVDELESLRKYEPSASVFNHSISKVGMKPGLDALSRLSYNDIHSSLKNSGLANHEELANTIWKRKENIERELA